MAYDEHINPLMAYIAEICRADKIAFGLILAVWRHLAVGVKRRVLLGLPLPSPI
jgi:hypothetical protein